MDTDTKRTVLLQLLLDAAVRLKDRADRVQRVGGSNLREALEGLDAAVCPLCFVFAKCTISAWLKVHNTEQLTWLQQWCSTQQGLMKAAKAYITQSNRPGCSGGALRSRD